ncbi:MAG: IS21 family transposase [Candidatus Thermoplasmatota archaeon]|nr:IS21 family transposase [Candidatus Thermoplasmatota archaeon]
MRERYRQGMSISQIAREEGLARITVRRYVQTDVPPAYVRSKNRESKLDPFKPFIRQRLKEYPLSAARLLSEIREQGYTGGYTILKEFTSSLRHDRSIQAEIRFETLPGEQAQVDWIDFKRVVIDGEMRHLWAFAAVLGHSRMRFVRFTTDATTPTFISCHMDAFDYFGGYTKTILYDNTKNVVLKRALKSSDSQWNPLFRDFFTHYDFTPRLCKPGIEGAKTKGKVERMVQHVRKDFYLGLDFDSLPTLNSLALTWCDEVNAKVHGTTYEVPFERLKLENLRPLNSVVPYQIAQTEFRRITRDCFVSYQSNKYSVPWRHAGRNCRLIIKNGRLDVLVDDEVVASHEVVPGAHRCIKLKEHFEGLYKAILVENRERHQDRLERNAPVSLLSRQAHDVDVERRDLGFYERFSTGGGP